ncbi:MAG: hypothetical protein KJN60_04825, partial [Boseongicola sp.]|nr:hypothetical protein [Boseongicola sp.]
YGSAPRRGVFDVDWQPMPWDRFKRGKRDCLSVEFSRPAALAAMIAAAETLATGTDFLRVDLYDIEGVPYFGEFAAYPHSGLASFVPADTSENENEIELEHGRLWP